MQIVLVQTLEDRQNPDYIEENGPFICNHATAWLGVGYYFWDTHIELGHWWGETIYKNNGSDYVICTYDAIIDNTCWDLHGNQMHLAEFKTVLKEIIKSDISPKKNVLVSTVIEHLRRKGILKYKAIRAYGVGSIKNRRYQFRLSFRVGNDAFLDLLPPIQVCLYEKKALSSRNYKIIFPLSYTYEEYI